MAWHALSSWELQVINLSSNVIHLSMSSLGLLYKLKETGHTSQMASGSFGQPFFARIMLQGVAITSLLPTLAPEEDREGTVLSQINLAW